MTHTFILTMTTDTIDEPTHQAERIQIADFVAQLLEPLVADRAHRRVRLINSIHLSTPDALISIGMDRERK